MRVWAAQYCIVQFSQEDWSSEELDFIGQEWISTWTECFLWQFPCTAKKKLSLEAIHVKNKLAISLICLVHSWGWSVVFLGGKKLGFSPWGGRRDNRIMSLLAHISDN